MHSAWLIVPAAGAGSRLGGEPKQFRIIANRSVLSHSLAAFEGLVGGAVIVTSDLARLHSVLEREPPPFPVQVVAGGATRLHSVAAGLAAVPGHARRILVHDAARPLVSRALIERCLHALDTFTACLAALPCPDTVWLADGDSAGEVIPRQGLWLAQTSQGFHTDIGKAAYARALEENWPATDDAGVLRRAGQRVAFVLGDAANRKITTADDLHLIEALLRLQA